VERGVVTFVTPTRLLLFVVVALLVLAYLVTQLRRRRYIVLFTNVDVVAEASPRHPLWRRHATAALFVVMLSALVVAFARPVHEVDVVRDGGAVIVALDVSKSMEATDVEPSRLVAARDAATDFVAALPARIRVGVVIFSQVASVPVLPTTNHSQAIRALQVAHAAAGTAIGEAMLQALVALRQRPALRDAAARADGTIRAAHIVILSDGETTSGRPSDIGAAAALAAKVPVSTIAFGTAEGRVRADGREFEVPVLRGELRKIAKTTHGQYFRASTAVELDRIYRDLGGRLGFRTEASDLSTWFVVGALIVGLLALGGAITWSGRVP
jgi:Ca-activated chloride channel family protein